MANNPASAIQDGLTRSISSEPPVHYIVKIQLFSLLAKNSIEKYESADFEAGGYKWKLVLYPSGNKSRNVEENISVYLAIADTSSFRCGWEVHAIFRLFLLDQNEDNYLIVQDAAEKERRFHGFKTQWGFDQFLPLRMFNDVSNGYLMDDTCVFGAEVFVTKEMRSANGECLSMINDPGISKHVWRIENFSKLDSHSECNDSQTFFAGGYKWKIQMYPKGRQHGSESHVSLYLALADSSTLPTGSKIFAEFTLRMVDQRYNKHIEGKVSFWFSWKNAETGWAKFVSFGYFYQPSNGCLWKDVCVVEAEVNVLGITNALCIN